MDPSARGRASKKWRITLAKRRRRRDCRLHGRASTPLSVCTRPLAGPSSLSRQVVQWAVTPVAALSRVWRWCRWDDGPSGGEHGALHRQLLRWYRPRVRPVTDPAAAGSLRLPWVDSRGPYPAAMHAAAAKPQVHAGPYRRNTSCAMNTQSSTSTGDAAVHGRTARPPC